MKWSGGTSGRPGTGRMLSAQRPEPKAISATARQNTPAPRLSCWNPIDQGPGCRDSTSIASARPMPSRRTGGATQNPGIERWPPCRPSIRAKPTGARIPTELGGLVAPVGVGEPVNDQRQVVPEGLPQPGHDLPLVVGYPRNAQADRVPDRHHHATVRCAIALSIRFQARKRRDCK
jgi:hypothetical protein